MQTSFTAAQVESEIRMMHATFDANVQPSPVIRSFLSREARRLFGVCQETDASWARTVSEEIALEAPYEEPVELPPNGGVLAIRGVPVQDPTKRAPISLVTLGGFDDLHFAYSIYVNGRNAHLRAGQWARVRGIIVEYVPKPIDVQGPDSTFVLPDDARPALVYRVAIGLAARNPANIAVPPATVQEWRRLAEEAEEHLRMIVGEVGIARVDSVQDVMP